jgi:hypothetical protein
MDEQRDVRPADPDGPPVAWPAPPPPPPAWPPPPPVGGAPPDPFAPPGADPYAYAPPAPRHRHGVRVWGLLLVALAILVADVAVLADRRGSSAVASGLPMSVAVEKQLTTERPAAAERRAAERDKAIDAMFARRADAVRGRDLAAFLGDVDPTQQEFRTRQREVFTSLERLDFDHWSYERKPDSYSPGSIDFERYGSIDDLWLPVLILRYRLKGFDEGEVGRRVVYTVVERDGRWFIAGDRDLEDITSSGTSVRVDPWENGPIVVSRGPHSIVIGHPDDRKAIGSIRREVEEAVTHVTRYVGRRKWARKVVVLLPTDDEELDAILENPTTYYDFAAVARPLATVPRGSGGREFAGSRVVINPDGFDAKSEFTTHLIRHEITHVAMFGRVGPLTPKWLVEGVAEYVGNAGARLPAEVLAAELTDAVEKSGVPTSLPTDSDFGLINDAGIGYNSAWLLCRYIASRYGVAKLLRFHDAMGTATGLDKPGDKLPRALRGVLGTNETALLAGWRQYVRAAVADISTLFLKPGAPFQESDRGRLSVADLARQKGLTKARLTAADVERTSVALWYDGPAKAPRRRLLGTLVSTVDEAGAAAVERMLTDRLRPYDSIGRPIPHGRIFYVGTEISGRHYNETIAVLRAGTLVMEVRVAVPGTGDSSADTRRFAAAQYALVD